jgi:predicted phosphodiesterase
MKLGLITDIHERVELLQLAIQYFRQQEVDQIVVIGDVFEMGERIAETCQLLADAKVIGVWGNHDFGLCVEPDDCLRATYGSGVLDYMTSLRPRLEISGYLFQHVEPWLNAAELMDLWYFEGMPDSAAKLSRIFESAPNRIFFAGHYHRWLLATPEELTKWAGEQPIRLESPNRYFVAIGALCDRWCAVFDTNSLELAPFRL